MPGLLIKKRVKNPHGKAVVVGTKVPKKKVMKKKK